jgi:hypothetical protein
VPAASRRWPRRRWPRRPSAALGCLYKGHIRAAEADISDHMVASWRTLQPEAYALRFLPVRRSLAACRPSAATHCRADRQALLDLSLIVSPRSPQATRKSRRSTDFSGTTLWKPTRSLREPASTCQRFAALKASPVHRAPWLARHDCVAATDHAVSADRFLFPAATGRGLQISVPRADRPHRRRR